MDDPIQVVQGSEIEHGEILIFANLVLLKLVPESLYQKWVFGKMVEARVLSEQAPGNMELKQLTVSTAWPER